MTDITETDRRLIDEIREASKHLMTPDFDTDYNILRFIKGYGYNKDEAMYYVQRHLKSRKAFQIDKLDQLEDDTIVKDYYPSGLLGTTGKNNRLVIIECVGRTDVNGLMKSIQATDFFRYRMKFFERVYKAMQEQERLTNQQSGVEYVFDLEGISMDPFLLTTLAGPYRILWGLIMINYPEWIHTTLVVNVPAFFSILWKTFSPIIPEATRKKVKLLNGDWRKQLSDYIDPACLPVHWGGQMVDENGDPMYRSKIVVPQGKIPPSLYWKNQEKYKELPDDQAKKKSVAAGTFSLWSYYVPEAGIVLDWYISCADHYTFAVYFTEDAKEKDIAKMDEAFPQVEVPGGLAPDRFHFVCDKPGAYHIKLGNEQAWLFSIAMRYVWRFTKPDGSPANVVSLNENGE